MKTRDEIVYDFMLALASNLPNEYLKFIEKYPEDADIDANNIFMMAHALTRRYLESL